MAGYTPDLVPLWAVGLAQYGAAANVIREIAANKWNREPPESLSWERVRDAGATGAAVGLAAGVGLAAAGVGRPRAKAKPKAKAAAAPDPPSPRQLAPNPAGVPDRGSTNRHDPLGRPTESRMHRGNKAAWYDPAQPPVGPIPPPARRSRISSPAVARDAGIRERG